MLLKKFRGIGPGVILATFLIALALWLNSFINPQSPSSVAFETDPMPLYGLIQSAFRTIPAIGILFSFCLVLLMAFLLVNYNTSEFFISERTFLPAIIYVLLSGLFPQFQILNPVLPAAVFLILAIRRIMAAYRIQGTAFNFFDAGLLLSTGSLFYANLMWFGLLIIIGIVLLRTGKIREWIISLLGLAAPWILIFGFYYVIGNDTGSLLSLLGNNLFFKSPGVYMPGITIAALIILAIIIITSLGHLLVHIKSKKIKSRKTFYLLIWELLISLALLIILPSVSAEVFWLTGIAASYLITHYFVFSGKKVISEFIFAVIFILIILVQVTNII